MVHMSFFVETEHAVQLRFIDSTTNEMGTGQLLLDIYRTYSIEEIIHAIESQLGITIPEYDVYGYYVDGQQTFHIYDIEDFQDVSQLHVDAMQVQDELWFELNQYENIVYVSEQLLNSVIEPIA